MPTVTKKSSKKTAPVKPSNGHKYEYTVEHGIQISGARISSLRNKFPFELMKVGDSFLIPAKDIVAKKPNTLHYAAKQFAKMKPGFMLTSRLQLNGERRVWRIK
jgi:hypothetical protein